MPSTRVYPTVSKEGEIMSMEYIEIRVDYARKIVELSETRRESTLQVLNGIFFTTSQTLIERMREGQRYFQRPTTEIVPMILAVCRNAYEYIRTIAHPFNYNVDEFVTQVLAVPQARLHEYLDGNRRGIEAEIELDVRVARTEVEAVAEQLSLSHSEFVDITIRTFTNPRDGNWHVIPKVKSSWPTGNWYQRNRYQMGEPDDLRQVVSPLPAQSTYGRLAVRMLHDVGVKNHPSPTDGNQVALSQLILRYYPEAVEFAWLGVTSRRFLYLTHARHFGYEWSGRQ